MKIDKNIANAYTYYEKYSKRLCILCKNWLHKNYIFFHNHLELTYKSF